MSLLVRAPGAFTTFQDLGRSGMAHLGVPRSGAADRGALRLANRLVGNPEGAPALEVLLGGLVLEAQQAAVVSVTGARCELTLDGRAVGQDVATSLVPGAVLTLGPPSRGVRSYLAVRGGFAVPAVLGSCSYDGLSDVGPPPLATAEVLHVGSAYQGPPIWERVAAAPPGDDRVLRVLPGPRRDWLPDGLQPLVAATWTVGPHSDRTGLRLDGPPLRRDPGELSSEGTLPGMVQVPPDGRPIVLGPDAGVTGGYPAVAVVVDQDLDALGQLAPGDRLRLALARP